jgi:hypothetical protein
MSVQLEIAALPFAFSVRPNETKTPREFRYYPAPPIISSYYKYQNVNTDPNLQHMVTTDYHEKVIEWIKRDKTFKKFKKFEKELKSDIGYEMIHKILKLFVKRGNTNWYDLKEQNSLIKAYIRHQLNTL